MLDASHKGSKPRCMVGSQDSVSLDEDSSLRARLSLKGPYFLARFRIGIQKWQKAEENHESHRE